MLFVRDPALKRNDSKVALIHQAREYRHAIFLYDTIRPPKIEYHIRAADGWTILPYTMLRREIHNNLCRSSFHVAMIHCNNVRHSTNIHPIRHVRCDKILLYKKRPRRTYVSHIPIIHH